MQQYAIIVAGGTGTRMNNAMPKQFLPIDGKPILYYSIHTFLQTFTDIHIIVVVHKNYIQNMQSVLIHFENRINITIVEGGETRYDSVKNGLHNIPNMDDAIVYVHDAARPFINKKLLMQLQSDCNKYGNAIPCLRVNESMRIILEEKSTSINRNVLRIVQTPQVFKANILHNAFLQQNASTFTDDATVCEANGEIIFLSDGLDENIKITTPAQWQMADWMIKNWEI